MTKRHAKQFQKVATIASKRKFGDQHSYKHSSLFNYSFAVYGARVWNSLPDERRSPDITLITFRNKLKSLLFNV